MKIATVIAVVLAIALGTVAVIIGLDTSRSPISGDNTMNSYTKVVELTEREKFVSLLSSDIGIADGFVIPTVCSDVYVTGDYSRFYTIKDGNITHMQNTSSITVPVTLNGETRDVSISYIESSGRIVGFGHFSEIEKVSTSYSKEVEFTCMLTDMPTACAGKEDEMLLLVRYSSSSVYSKAFAINIKTLKTRNIFPDVKEEASGHIILTDELVRNSGEYLYYFSKRNYEQPEKLSYENGELVDLYRMKDGKEELVAEKVHNNYVAQCNDGKLRYIRNDYSKITKTIGVTEITAYTDSSFSVIALDMEKGTETVEASFSLPFSSNVKRDGNVIAMLEDEGRLLVYNILTGNFEYYDVLDISTLAAFSSSEDYIVAGGSSISVETGRQRIVAINLRTDKKASALGMNMFYNADECFKLFDGMLLFTRNDVTEGKHYLSTVLADNIIFEFSDDA